MNKYGLITLFITSLLLLFSLPVASVYAQTSNHTAREEQEGKKTWEQLQTRETSCDKLSDDNFQALGEYYMGQMTGTSHEAMNTMMTQMMGEEGEKQMHTIMGKRLSGCNTSAEFPSQGTGFMPMMWNFWGGFGSWLFQLSVIVWLIVGALTAVWLFKQISKK